MPEIEERTNAPRLATASVVTVHQFVSLLAGSAVLGSSLFALKANGVLPEFSFDDELAYASTGTVALLILAIGWFGLASNSARLNLLERDAEISARELAESIAELEREIEEDGDAGPDPD